MTSEQIRQHYPCPPINKPEDIPGAGWVGNFHYDQHRFNAIAAYIVYEQDREKQREAIHLCTLHGMGIDLPVTDADISEFVLNAIEIRKDGE